MRSPLLLTAAMAACFLLTSCASSPPVGIGLPKPLPAEYTVRCPPPPFGDVDGPYPFRTVEGPGVYEIPVGPVHAGMIGPGHFRFSVVGETVLNLKARLWFVHRGLEKLFAGRAVAAGVELAERVSGDTTVGHALAYVRAVEDAILTRARQLRVQDKNL